ncbi:MAG: N-formylglutamate deformylase [Parvularculaceae bacterium]|nr:N-formylglutamate deformylase [Parvularculaceae bacterium]
MNPVTIHLGDGPVILGQPHCGTFVPKAINANLNDQGRELLDTDWHVDQLYEDLLPQATVVRANFHRYVIDANRDPSGQSLYPGQATTGLIPETTFDDQPIWREPIAAQDIRERLSYHQAYHNALQRQIARIKAQWGIAVLYDCHSIRSYVPNLFAGELPVFNIGDNGGQTCASALSLSIKAIASGQERYTYVANGRFRGGWTTRHYGQPQNGVHAIQMELAQSAYLATEKPPFTYDAEKAGDLRAVLASILKATDEFAREHAREGAGNEQPT